MQQNNDHKNYPQLPSINSKSSKNTHYLYYDPRLRTQQSPYLNTTPIPTYTSPRFQQQYQPKTTIADLAEPISVFDDLKFPKQRRSKVIPFPSIYIPSNPNRRTSVIDARLATASAMRQQLLTDIQHNISEIDQELSSLTLRSAIARDIPLHLSAIDKKTPLPNDENRIWSTKPKKIYEVIPRITSELKKNSQQSTPNLIDQTTSQLFIGQYHYGPEMEETEIVANDPENSDLKSMVTEISQINFHEILSPDQFRREQSVLSQHRALIFVPEYGDNNEIKVNETTEDFHQNNSLDTNIVQSSTVSSLSIFGSSNKLNIHDFELLIQTAPEAKVEIPPLNIEKPDELPDEIEADLANTILSKPVKHSHLSQRSEETHSSNQETITNTENNTARGMTYFFSDFGSEGEEDLISIDPRHFDLPTGSDIIPYDNISNVLIRQSQTSLLNPHSSQQQQLTIENNNEHLKETESKKIDVPTKNITSPSTLPSKKILPILNDDNTQTQFERNKKNLNQNQQETSMVVLNMNTIEQSRKNELNNSSIELHPFSPTSEQKPSSIKINSPQQRSADIPKISTESILNNKQETPVESRHNSALPVPLNSPDINNIRPSTSRSTTPERRNSISSLDQNILLTSTDIINFDNPSIEDFPTKTEHDAPSPLVNTVSLQENQDQNPSPSDNNQLQSISPNKSEHDDLHLPSISPPYLTSLDPEEPLRQSISPDHDNNQLKERTSESKHSSPIDEEPPLITESQRRSKLSLSVHRAKPKRKKSLDNQTHVDNNKKADQHRRVSFSNHISHIQIEAINPLKNWRERINNILAKKHFSNEKYSHIKSRVNSFANFEYQPRKIMIMPKKKSYQKKPKQTIPPGKVRTSQEPTGRIRRLSDGRTKIFHETIEWNVQSKLKSYSFENLHYKSRGNDTTVINQQRKWHSESRLSEFVPHRQSLTQTISLPTIIDIDEQNFDQQESEIKIFDINSNSLQSISKFQESFLSTASLNSKQSDKLIFDKKPVWKKESKLKDAIWENINYQPKKSKVQIFHQPTHWTSQSKILITHSLTWDIQAKVKYWSETDLNHLTKQKSLFSQYHNPEWNDIITDNQDLRLEENFNDQIQEKSPANRPKWNSVSQTRSVNSVYNPKVSNSNLIRRGWDRELRRRRVHRLPPLKRKRHHDEIPQLAIEAPASNDPLAIDYNYDNSVTAHEHTTTIDYATTSSRQSSKALVPLRPLPELQLLPETPRSQRPVQQEWYDELNKSRLTHRTDMGRTRNSSLQDSTVSIHQTNTPRELLTLRSSTRNSQNSAMSGTALLDSSIRTNRATELRLSKDMEEHHQHSHDPSQSMPFEIRGFRLEGTQLTVSDNATIRPLSNVNYHASERVKNRRIYPWSNLHPNETSSRNSLLLPITEFRHPSFETSFIEVPKSIHEE